jgi:CRP-like cAMP-binding protein
MPKNIFLTGLPEAIGELYPGFSGEDSLLFFNQWKHWDLGKEHVILREGQIADYIWFVEKGCIRIYYNKEDKDITEWIALDQQFFMSITSFFKRVPGKLIIQTIEKTSLWGIHYNDLMRLADEHNAIGKLLRQMVIGSLILSQERMESIQFETALQRYQRLLSTSPDIVQRVPMQFIASFLGITKETLSRIRGMH